MPFGNKRLPFYVGITTLVVAIILFLSGLFVWIVNRESKVAALQMAEHLFTTINARNLRLYEDSLKCVASLTGTAVRMPGMAARPSLDGMSHPGIAVMFEILTFHDFLFSVYCGYDDGSFIQLIAVRDQEKLRQIYGAPQGTWFVLRTIAPNEFEAMEECWQFLTRDHQLIKISNDLDPGYDPRKRPWYTRAQQNAGAFFTKPYVFSSSKLPGVTCSEILSGGGGVLGVDVTLDRFAMSLKQQKVSDHAVLFVFDHDGTIILNPKENPVKLGKDNQLTFLKASEFKDPRIHRVVSNFLENTDIQVSPVREISISNTPYLVRFNRVSSQLNIDQLIAVAAPVSDFTGHITRMQNHIVVFAALMLLVMIPLSFFIARTISSSLMRLEIESRKIRESDFSGTDSFDSGIKEIHSLITAFFMMKKTISHLLAQQRNLFDNFVKLIAGAIDAKSAYTGGHCARVPVIAMMLAGAACKCDKGPFAEFTMDSADDRWEFEVAAWLHDCGKVTTPEHVVDKATKLETIYNRIHEIRMRFEVLLRDARIAYYRNRLDGERDPEQLKAEFKDACKDITDDFIFVAGCNTGEEFMADEKIERLKRIAGRTWMRHLDDRIGISEIETALKCRAPAPVLPVEEHVLADKDEHQIPRQEDDPFKENPHGFNMPVPELLYNQGELYNLSIRKGTLSAEDRFKIQDHIVQTINMLGKLEFPDYLAHVPEYAGAHHETMIGTGYPRGQKKENMSIPARIMAIADIFEALTAADRPYKPAKSLGEALRIMSFMRNDQDIDPDLFDLFLTSGVYKTYASQYLKPEQLDVVDIRTYLSSAQKPTPR